MDQQHQPPPPNGQFGGNNPGQMQPGQQQHQFQQYQFQPIGHQHQRFAQQQQPVQPMQPNQPVQENRPMQLEQQSQVQQMQQMQQHNPQQPQQMQPNQFMQQHYWHVQQMMHRHYQQQQYEMNLNVHQEMRRQQAIQQQQQVQQRQQLQNQMQLQQNGQRPLEMQQQMLNIQVQLNVQQEMQRNQQMRRQPMLAIEDGNGQEVRNAEPQEPRPRPPVAAAPPEIPAPSLLLQMLMKQGSPDAAPLQLNNPMVMHPEPQPPLPGQRGADQLKRKLPDVSTIDDSPSGSSVPVKRDRIDRDFMGNVAGNDARRGQSGPSNHQQKPAPHRPQPQEVPTFNAFNNAPFDIANGYAHEEVVGAEDARAEHQMDQQEEDPQAIIENLRRQLDRAQAQLAKRDEYIDKLQKENAELKSRFVEARPQSMPIESPADTLASGSSDNPSPEMMAAQQQRAGQFVAQFAQAPRASVPMVNQNVRANSMPALDPINRYAMGRENEHRIVRIKQEVPDEYDNAGVDTSGIFVDRVLNPQNVQFRNFEEALDYWKEYFEPAAQQTRIEQVLGEKLGRKHLKNYLFNPDDDQRVPQEKYKVCRNANQMIPRLFEWTASYQSWADMDCETRNKWRRAKKVIEEIQRQQVRCGLISLKP
ncbi:hypothetical protein CAEBREN_00934 [Caenorhabditis brenneri]|uniref:Uncharacterized protein n=1 Tax=Caenorhabditis brenneri TaxID=135651 RepID=G0MMT3_CAEBE|nr:hypothetical protein CAEBREN_00934 [Caenorhabditis brenneri]